MHLLHGVLMMVHIIALVVVVASWNILHVECNVGSRFGGSGEFHIGRVFMSTRE